MRPAGLPTSAVLFGKGDDTASWVPFARTELSTLIERFTRACTGREEGVRTHALRHANASYLLDAGLSLDDIKDLLGHSNPQLTARYAERLRPMVPTDHATSAFAELERAV